MAKSTKSILLLLSFLILGFAVAGAVGGKSRASEDGAYRQLGVYSEVLARIRSDYVENPNIALVSSGALHGLLESLDSSSSYLSPDEYKRLEAIAPQAGGIGAAVSKRFGYGNIISVIPGGPADKAGLVAGDVVEALDGKSTHDMSLALFTDLLQGPVGSKVELSVVRPDRAQPKRITVTRDVVKYPPVSAKMLDGGIGYLRVEGFPAGRSQEIAAQVRELEKNGAAKLILDLRNSGDGEISEGIATAGLFLDHGEIAYVKGQKYPRQDFSADPAHDICRLPMVAIVSRSTAGPAEIVAGAILDNHRGDVLGDKTYGSGSIQKTIPLDNGGVLILSVAKYYTPKGTAIEDDAITPNVLVAEKGPELLTNQDGEEDEFAPQENENVEPKKPIEKPDEQLRRAIELLNKPTQKSAAAA